MSVFYSAKKRGFYHVELHNGYFIERVTTSEDGETLERWLEPDPEGPINDAVEVSDDDYRNLLEGQSNGKKIEANSIGYPVLVDKDPVSFDTLKSNAKSKIDTAAGAARQRFVSAGQLIEEEYRLALQQVQAWRAAGSPAEDVPAAITGWIGATSMTAEQAAVDIEQTAAAWEQVLLQIRSLRLEGKAMVDAAADDVTEITTIAESYVQKLNDIKPVSA